MSDHEGPILCHFLISCGLMVLAQDRSLCIASGGPTFSMYNDFFGSTGAANPVATAFRESKHIGHPLLGLTRKANRTIIPITDPGPPGHFPWEPPGTSENLRFFRGAMSAAVRGSSQRMSSKGSHGSRDAGRSTAAVGRAMLGARPRSKEPHR